VTYMPRIEAKYDTPGPIPRNGKDRMARAREILEGLPQTDRVAELAQAILAELEAGAQT
jgi:hypothetical protein